MARKRRSTNGKQKIEIKKIESEEARQVCFSKRKAGIFSKANEIATLCGAKVAVLIQSPAGCPFTFGSPSVNHVIRRFLNDGAGVNETEENEAQRLLKIQELNNKVMEASSKYEEALKRRKSLVRRIAELCEANEDVRRIENVEDLNKDELRKMIESLDKFQKAVRAKLANDIAAKSAKSFTTHDNANNEGPSHVNGNPILTNLNFSGFGTGQWSANPFTTHGNSNNEGPSHVNGNPNPTSLNSSGFGTGQWSAKSFTTHDNSEGPSHVNGNPILTNLNFSGFGTGQWSAKSFATHGNLNNEGPSHFNALDINLNLFEGGSLGHFGELNPIMNPNATNFGPNEPGHIPLPVSGRGLVELDLLGGRVNFAAEEEPK